MRYYCLFFTLVFLTSCNDFFNKEIDDFTSDYTPQLSLFALLQPQDSFLIVDVRQTISSFGGRPGENGFRNNLEGAEVTVSDGTTTLPLELGDFSSVRSYFLRLDEAPEGFLRPGGSYLVQARFEDLRAEATAIIPLDSVVREDVNFTIEEENNDGFVDVRAIADIPNLPGDDEYYLVTINRESFPNGSGQRREELVDFVHARDALGDRLVFKAVDFFEFTLTTVRICVTDAATYEFLNARATAINNNENPFAEATLLPSNVTEGVGLVGGMNCELFRFRR